MAGRFSRVGLPGKDMILDMAESATMNLRVSRYNLLIWSPVGTVTNSRMGD